MPWMTGLRDARQPGPELYSDQSLDWFLPLPLLCPVRSRGAYSAEQVPGGSECRPRVSAGCTGHEGASSAPSANRGHPEDQAGAPPFHCHSCSADLLHLLQNKSHWHCFPHVLLSQGRYGHRHVPVAPLPQECSRSRGVEATSMCSCGRGMTFGQVHYSGCFAHSSIPISVALR